MTGPALEGSRLDMSGVGPPPGSGWRGTSAGTGPEGPFSWMGSFL